MRINGTSFVAADGDGCEGDEDNLVPCASKYQTPHGTGMTPTHVHPSLALIVELVRKTGGGRKGKRGRDASP